MSKCEQKVWFGKSSKFLGYCDLPTDHLGEHLISAGTPLYHTLASGSSPSSPPVDFTGAPSPWEILGAEVGKLVATKNKAYGDSFARSGAIMAILYPQGISLEKLPDALAVVRIIDKLFRIATDRDALGEDPWRDVVGYGLLAAERRRTK